MSRFQQENPNTYFVQDRSNQEELRRLQIQDQMITTGMGGVLPEQEDPAQFRNVLDVACGTGGWLIEVAKTYPSITQLVGIDVSQSMIDYANTQASAQGVSDRVSFHVMDALATLKFPNKSFDLVNQRLGVSFLRLWDWSRILSEYQRVARPGAIIRITESSIQRGNSPAFLKLIQLFLQSLYNAGNLKSADGDALIRMLPELMTQYGIHYYTQSHPLRFPAGTPAGALFAEDMKYGFRTLIPFFNKWTKVPNDYEIIYQQMVKEMQKPNFVGEWDFLTIWGPNGNR
jgi:ubiquinone/menaquinone biosynthesis C-methylase UbiE